MVGSRKGYDGAGKGVKRVLRGIGEVCGHVYGMVRTRVVI